MPMSNKGLNKLMEECGELITECAKKAAYMHADDHWDGKGSLKKRIENEMGDVMAAISFVIGKFNLDAVSIYSRSVEKFEIYRQWDKGQE